MASRDNHDHPTFTSKTPHFFKVILDETIRDGILGVPRKFVRDYGNQLSSHVKLEVPCGVIWPVELTTKTDGRVRLEKGWPEFAKHYSMEAGTFVVFGYKGNDHFHVLIFDKTATEIEYPYSTSTEEDDDHDDVSAPRKNKEKTDLPCPLPRKKRRTDSKFENLSSHISLDHDPKAHKSVGSRSVRTRRSMVADTQCPSNSREFQDSKLKIQTKSTVEIQNKPDLMDKTKMNPMSSTEKQRASAIVRRSSPRLGVGGLSACRSVKSEVSSCCQRLTVNEKARAIQIDNAFKSTGKPFFMVFMRPSYVSDTCRMSMPADFAREYLTMHKSNLTLRNSNGEWPTKYYTNPNLVSPKATLYGGWSSFVEDNYLNVGDVCVFELIKQRSEIIMEVAINPVVENLNTACRPMAHGGIASRVKTRKMEDPTDSYIEILDENQKRKKKSSSSSFQPCKVMRTNQSGSIQAKGTKLEKEKKSMNSQHLTKELGGKIKMEPFTQTEKQRTCVGASGFRTANPSFRIVMQPSYVLAFYPPHIPEEFAKTYLKKTGEIILRVPNGRTWSVEYERKSSNGRTKSIFSGKSWRPFARDNELKVGNICIFELNEENGNLLEVVIQRDALHIEID